MSHGKTASSDGPNREIRTGMGDSVHEHEFAL